MDSVFLSFMDQFGYLAVAALVFLECVFPPIPSEVIIPAAGALCLTTGMVLPGAVAAATVGAVAGATVLYGVGRVLSRERLGAFFETRPMRLLGFHRADVERVVDWFDRKGQITVLFCRCIPGVRSLISIPAGTARMPLPRFLAFTTAGTVVWNVILCGLGYGAGSAWQRVSDQVAGFSDMVKYVLLAAVVAAACWWVCVRILPRLHRQAA